MTEQAKHTAAARPWGIHAIGDLYDRSCGAGLPDGSWVLAVAEPYHSNMRERLRAVWWIMSGKAHAFVWPKSGDLERALAQRDG